MLALLEALRLAVLSVECNRALHVTSAQLQFDGANPGWLQGQITCFDSQWHPFTASAGVLDSVWKEWVQYPANGSTSPAGYGTDARMAVLGWTAQRSCLQATLETLDNGVSTCSRCASLGKQNTP